MAIVRQIQIERADCLLATIAMLSGVSIKSVNAIARRILDSHWKGSWYESIEFNRSMGDYFVSNICSACGISPITRSIWNAFNSSSSGSDNTPSLIGKGQLTVKLDCWRTGHSMAYENGLIYDPVNSSDIPSNGETWKTWLKRMGNDGCGRVKWVVTPIVNLKGD